MNKPQEEFFSAVVTIKNEFFTWICRTWYRNDFCFQEANNPIFYFRGHHLSCQKCLLRGFTVNISELFIHRRESHMKFKRNEAVPKFNFISRCLTQYLYQYLYAGCPEKDGTLWVAQKYQLCHSKIFQCVHNDC